MKGDICNICGSNSKVYRYKNKMPLCVKHYTQMIRHGNIKKERERNISNNIIIQAGHLEIHFKNGEVGLFDLEDKELIESAYWGIDVHGYIHGKVKGKLARYHRHLFNFPKQIIDHINRNKLDNRKVNLRLCSPKENSRNLSLAKNNKTGVTGVRKTKYGKWNARITVDRKEIYLGNYDTLEEAAKARKEAENKYFGEFAPNR